MAIKAIRNGGPRRGVVPSQVGHRSAGDAAQVGDLEHQQWCDASNGVVRWRPLEGLNRCLEATRTVGILAWRRFDWSRIGFTGARLA